jgi:hypothetical protein
VAKPTRALYEQITKNTLKSKPCCLYYCSWSRAPFTRLVLRGPRGRPGWPRLCFATSAFKSAFVRCWPSVPRSCSSASMTSGRTVCCSCTKKFSSAVREMRCPLAKGSHERRSANRCAVRNSSELLHWPQKELHHESTSLRVSGVQAFRGSGWKPSRSHSLVAERGDMRPSRLLSKKRNSCATSLVCWSERLPSVIPSPAAARKGSTRQCRREES